MKTRQHISYHKGDWNFPLVLHQLLRTETGMHPAWIVLNSNTRSFPSRSSRTIVYPNRYFIETAEASLINGKNVVAVFPAYNAEKTLRATVMDLPDTVDRRILVDDGSSDATASLGRELGLEVYVHDSNYGYGRNQQTCYREALAAGADIVVMVHPDYQYTPLLVTAMASMIAYGVYDVVLGSRIIGGGALAGGMPYLQVRSNRV